MVFSVFKDFQAPVAPEHENLVMHAELITEHGFNLRVSDGAALSEAPAQATTNMEASFVGTAEDVETTRPWFAKLSDGATNIQPLTATPWGAPFGSLTDKFGIAWIFNFGG